MTTEPARILVVEDDADCRYLLRQFLTQEGYSVIEAEHGEVAQDAMRRECIDLVLLDVMMPGIDGFEFARWMRRNARYTVLGTAVVLDLRLEQPLGLQEVRGARCRGRPSTRKSSSRPRSSEVASSPR